MATTMPGEPESERSHERRLRSTEGPPQTGYVGPYGIHAPTAGFSVGLILLLIGLLGIVNLVDMSTVVAVILVLLGFILVGLTTTPLGSFVFKGLGFQLEMRRRNGNDRVSPPN